MRIRFPILILFMPGNGGFDGLEHLGHGLVELGFVGIASFDAFEGFLDQTHNLSFDSWWLGFAVI